MKIGFCILILLIIYASCFCFWRCVRAEYYKDKKFVDIGYLDKKLDPYTHSPEERNLPRIEYQIFYPFIIIEAKLNGGTVELPER